MTASLQSHLYDAHLHLQFEELQANLGEITAELDRIHLNGAVVNGTTPDDWPAVSALADRFRWVVPSYGVHPWDCGNRPREWLNQLKARLAAEPRARIGEIGLDQWILERAKPDDPRLTGLRRAPLDEQLDVFNAQLALAAHYNRAASIHCLDAWGALLDALKTTARPACGFLLHAYSGPLEMVSAFTALGAYFSFNGSFLDPRKEKLRAVYTAIPANRLLVETDAPAMSLPAALARYALPAGPGGEPVNHPANLVATYDALASWRSTPLPALAAQIEANFLRLFTPAAK